MPPAAIVAGAAVAAGLGGTAIAAATGAGKSRFAGQTFNQSNQYDPQAYQYGGTPGGADNAANTAGGNMNNYNNVAGFNQAAEQGQVGNQWQDRLDAKGDSGSIDQALNQSTMDRGLSLADRNSVLAAQGQAAQSRGLGLQSRGQQQQMLNLAVQRAGGMNLIADREAGAARRNLALNMRSAAASARGPAALANAQSDAMAAGAQGLAGINYNATTAAQQEQQANEQAAFGEATGIRSGDLGLNSQDQGQQQTNIGLINADTGVRGQDVAQGGLAVNKQQNDISQQNTDVGAINAYNNGAAQAGNIALGYGNLQNNIRTEQGNLTSQGANQAQQSFEDKQHIDSGTAANSAQTDLGYVKMAQGAVSGGSQAVGAAMPTPAPGPAPVAAAEHGGPVAGGKPVLVGEKGPELMVPKQDAVVIPAPQTAGLVASLRSGADRDRQAIARGEFVRPADNGMVPLDETENAQLHQGTGAEGRAFYEQNPIAVQTGPSLSGDAGEQLAAAQGRPSLAVRKKVPAPAAAPRPHKMTPEEMMAAANAMGAQMQDQHDARMAHGPAVVAREEGGPVAAGQPAIVGEKGPEVVVVAPHPHPLPPPPAPPADNREKAVGFAGQRPMPDHRTAARSLSLNGRRRQGEVHLAMPVEAPTTPLPTTEAEAAPPGPHPLPLPKPPPIRSEEDSDEMIAQRIEQLEEALKKAKEAKGNGRR
jgi:hypothetical protein